MSFPSLDCVTISTYIRYDYSSSSVNVFARLISSNPSTPQNLLATMQLRTIIIVSFPTSILAAVGGPCSNGYQECICLDRSVCEDRWGGLATEGVRGSWPCPNDPSNVWGYRVYKCRGSNTWCSWRNECVGRGTILPGKGLVVFTLSSFVF